MPASQQALQSQLEDLVARHQVPGAVAGVWRDGELTTAAAGTANGNTGVPMTADTAFATGSITKVWATTMYHTLIENGVLDLDVPIVEYAPDIQFGADRDVAGTLTFRNLLNHSSGVDSGDLFVPTRPYPEGVEDYLGPLTWAGKLTEPGVVSSYNNDGWIIGELVLRRMTGKNFHQLLRERVIGPMGLRRTVLSADEAMLHRTAIGHYPGPDGRYHPTPQFLYPDTWAAPGTTNITTVEDTIAFLRLHLAGGVTADGTRVLSAESVQAMQTPTSPYPTGPQSGFGLGWMYLEQDGRRVFSHGGGSLGGVAHALISPEHSFALVSFANGSMGNPLHADLISLLFPEGPSPLATPSAPARHDVPLEPFTGTFRRKTERTDITQEAGELVVRVTPILAELAGATVTRTGEVGEFRALPTSETTVVSSGDLPGGSRTLTFHEEAPGGFQLMFSGRRLARRIRG
jgi:CubicO group peptidase (beta-lactamase class C family)